MRHLLSIRTVFPRAGNRIWYDDQRQVHQQLYEGEESVDYAFMGTDADAADNRWLREAWEQQIPLLYFLGISPGRYHAIVPAFIAGWDRQGLKARVAFGLPGEQRLAGGAAERRYALRIVKQRLHQASFRDAVISAYQGRCALSGLPEPMLLDAAHIIADRKEDRGAACRAQRHSAVQDPSRRVRRPSHRYRPGLHRARRRAAACPERLPDARSAQAAARQSAAFATAQS